MRRVVLILVLLLAGAVVNVAVAWGCAVSHDPYFIRATAWGSTEDYIWWNTHKPAGFPRMPIEIAIFSSFGLSGRYVVNPQLPAGSTDMRYFDDLTYLRTGWPIRTFEGSRWDRAGSGPTFFYATDFGTGGRWVALRPVFPGFLLGSIFYGLILWLPRCSFALRRLIRRRRGLCPACAYLMGESPTCTECGRTLPGRTEAVT